MPRRLLTLQDSLEMYKPRTNKSNYRFGINLNINLLVMKYLNLSILQG